MRFLLFFSILYYYTVHALPSSIVMFHKNHTCMVGVLYHLIHAAAACVSAGNAYSKFRQKFIAFNRESMAYLTVDFRRPLR